MFSGLDGVEVGFVERIGHDTDSAKATVDKREVQLLSDRRGRNQLNRITTTCGNELSRQQWPNTEDSKCHVSRTRKSRPFSSQTARRLFLLIGMAACIFFLAWLGGAYYFGRKQAQAER